ncbi:MAG: Clp protease ClpP [Synergistaceae bacterium]|nr:Clp protease ClpP [Synergistaceae bacterium]
MYKMRIRNESEVSDIELYIDSSIEHDIEGYVSARKLREQLDGQVFNKVILKVNSDGGDLLEGLAIYEFMKELQASGHEIEAIITGICSSSASVIVMSCSKITMNKNAYMMIHEPVISLSGTSEELLSGSEFLKDLREKIINIYSERTQESRDVIESLMKKELWLNAETCKLLGLCDEVIAVESAGTAAAESQKEARMRDSAELRVSNNYRRVDQAKTVIESMARVINRKRGYVK